MMFCFVSTGKLSIIQNCIAIKLWRTAEDLYSRFNMEMNYYHDSVILLPLSIKVYEKSPPHSVGINIFSTRIRSEHAVTNKKPK